MRTSLLVVASALCVSGCISLFPDPPPAARIFPLNAQSNGPRAQAAAPLVVAVAEPRGADALMGDDIVWRQDGVIAFMGGAQWPGAAPSLLQDALVQTLTRRGGVAGAVRTDDSVRADLEVRWDIVAFQVEEDGALTARFAADVKLVDARTRRILAAHVTEHQAPLADRSQRAAAQALSEAANAGVRDIAGFVEAHAQAAPVAVVAGS